MGMILSFIPPKGQGRRTGRAQNGAAAVIIFPGVRYERLKGSEPRIDETVRASASPDKPPPCAEAKDDRA